MAQNNDEQNRVLMEQFAGEVFGQKELSGLDKYMREDYIQHNPMVGQGRKGFRDFFRDWFAAVQDFDYSLKKIIINDDHIWVYGSYSGTQTGEWLGLPASNKSYSFDAVDIFRVQDGKLAEHWDVLDVYNLFKQLGTIQ